jgi:hypothetical protein
VQGNLSAEAWKGEDVSRNESEPVSASLIRQGKPGTKLDFLGFTLRYDRGPFGGSRRYLNVVPSDQALARARDKLRELTDREIVVGFLR